MACPCRRNKVIEITDDDTEIAEAYGGTFENEGNILHETDRGVEQVNIGDYVKSSNGKIYTELIFGDGNDGDLKACEYEDSLMERIWWLSKPPKIPRQTCMVPARRIQVMKERLSPVLTGLPNTRKASGGTVNGKGHRRNKINSNVDYVRIMDFEDGIIQASCQTKTVTIIPNCARKLEDLL